MSSWMLPLSHTAQATNEPREQPQIMVLEQGRTERHYWRDLWAYRELFAILAWRDVAVRYKQTVLGAVWAIVRPLVTMVVLGVVFGRLARLPSQGMPYSVMVFAGVLPWFLFSTILSGASGSMIANTHLVSKVYFPRLIIPTATAVVAVFDFALNLMVLMVLLLWFGIMPSWRLLLLPPLVGLAILASLGPAFLLAALNVKYRDFRYLLPFLVQLGLYVSPVGFSSAIVPDRWRFWYSLNPLVGIIDGFRWCVFGGGTKIYLPGFFLSLLVIAFFLWLGIRYFRSTEPSLADLL
jgi:lipopolysaccharide transport system permease protein